MKIFCLILITSILSTHVIHARIGDSKSALKSRLTSKGGGLLVDDKVDGPIQRSPLGKTLNALLRADGVGGSIAVASYWKSADGKRVNTYTLKNPASFYGWHYHAIFLRGTVVAESHSRIVNNGNTNINSFEMDGLLVVNRGGATWQRLNNMRTPDGTEIVADGRYQYVLDNQSVLARLGDGRPSSTRRDSALFIRKELVDILVKFDSEAQEERREEQKSTVATSLSGF